MQSNNETKLLRLTQFQLLEIQFHVLNGTYSTCSIAKSYDPHEYPSFYNPNIDPSASKEQQLFELYRWICFFSEYEDEEMNSGNYRYFDEPFPFGNTDENQCKYGYKVSPSTIYEKSPFDLFFFSRFVNKEKPKPPFKTYLLKDHSNGLIKIGKSRNIIQRIKTIYLCNNNVKLLCYLDKDVETELHQLYKDKRVAKEWFELTEEDVMDIINKYSFVKAEGEDNKPLIIYTK